MEGGSAEALLYKYDDDSAAILHAMVIVSAFQFYGRFVWSSLLGKKKCVESKISNQMRILN